MMSAAPATPVSKTQAAMWYARNGFAVFPVARRDKHPATAHGFKDATLDEAQIRQWWGADPEYNIGVPPADRPALSSWISTREMAAASQLSTSFMSTGDGRIPLRQFRGAVADTFISVIGMVYGAA